MQLKRKNNRQETSSEAVQPQPKKRRIRNRQALRRGTYATAITALFVAGVIILNVLASALANRFPLAIDLTTDSVNSITQEYVGYIQQIEKDVEIIMCADEDDFANGYYENYISSYYNIQDKTGRYFGQIKTLLDLYAKYNTHLDVQYADPQEPSFADITARFSDVQFNYGSIIVSHALERNGETMRRNKVLNISDMFEMVDETEGYAAYGYAPYYISGSSLEASLTSALLSVTAENTVRLGYDMTHCDESTLSQIEQDLIYNNYEIVKLDSMVLTQIPADLDGMIIAGPFADYSKEEIATLEAFLSNDGKLGKSLYVFASVYYPDMPNLYEFLTDWGISVGTGTLIETNDNNYLNTPTNIGLLNSGSSFTTSVNTNSSAYIADSNAPITITFESYRNRTTTTVMSSSNNCVVRPAGAPENWTPDSSAARQSYPTMVVSQETDNGQSSQVVVCASMGFLTTQYLSDSRFGNKALLIALLNNLSGVDNDNLPIVTKTINSETITVTEAAVSVMRVIFMILLPIALIAAGFVVWYRRKNR